MIPIPPKKIDVSHGEFPCPGCKQQTTFKHIQRVTRHLVHLIPVLGDVIEEYVECQKCRQKYSTDILRTGLSGDIKQVLDSLKDKLLSGKAIQEVEATLLQSGIDAAHVKRYVSVAAGISHKHCPNCQLTYRDEVMKCHKCGHVLPPRKA